MLKCTVVAIAEGAENRPSVTQLGSRHQIVGKDGVEVQLLMNPSSNARVQTVFDEYE